MLIGDVARRSGVSTRMLRHYDSLGLVRPTGRTRAGYREYSGEDIRRILHVEMLRSLGLSLRDVGRALDDPGFAPPDLVGDLIRRTKERIAAEMELLTRLRRISAAEPADWEDVLQTVALLQALGSENAGKRQRAALSSVAEGPVPVEALVEATLQEPAVAARIAAGLVDCLARDDIASAARRRLTQALADIPGTTTSRALARLSRDEDRAVALTATYILRLRNARRHEQSQGSSS